MDTWGQGPWFDPEAPDQPPHDEDQHDQQRGAPGGAPDASLPWNVESAPMLGAESSQAPDARMLAGGGPDAGRYGDPGAGGAIEDAPTRAYPPIAAGPRSLPGDPAASSPRGCLPFPYTPVPRSRPLSQPLDFGLGTPMAGAAGMAGSAGGMGAGRADQQRDKRRRPGLRALFVIVPVALLLIACLSAGLLSNALLHLPGSASGAPSAQGGDSAGGPFTILPTGTPTSRPTPTPRPSPTPIPPPTAATITFTTASQSLASPGAMTACPSNCDLTAKTFANSQLFSATFPATQIPQSALTGMIHVVNAGPGNWIVPSPGYSFTGGGFACAPQPITLPPNAPHDYFCFIAATTPPSIAAGTIKGTVSASPQVTYTQPAPLQGNGGYEVLSQDCAAALDNVKNTQGAPWAQSWISGQTLPSGWQFAQSAPTITFSGDTCPLGKQQATTFDFTASSTTNVSDIAYHPADAQALAASRLASQIPGGDALKAGSQTTCTPAVQGVSGTTITVTCSDAGIAFATWTSDRKAQLTAAIAGKSKTAALATCNATPGVQANSCAITIQGGDGTLLPASAAVITVDARLP